MPFQDPLLIRDDSNRFILNIFRAAFYHFSKPGPCAAALLSGYGTLIPSYLVDHDETPPRSRVVVEIENSIIHNYPDCNFELDAYLRSLPFSYDYLRKLFRREMGVTPHKYLMDKRLQMVAASLSSPYMDVGGNILYFSRMFKKKYGVSPSIYQKRAPARPDLTPDNVKIMLDECDV